MQTSPNVFIGFLHSKQSIPWLCLCSEAPAERQTMAWRWCVGNKNLSSTMRWMNGYFPENVRLKNPQDEVDGGQERAEGFLLIAFSKKGHCSLSLPNRHCPSLFFSDQYESVTERISKAGWMKTSQQIQISLQSPNSPGYPHSFPLRSRRRSLSKSTSQATTAAWSLQCETLWVTADSIDPLQESQSWLSGANRGSHFWLIPPLDA